MLVAVCRRSVSWRRAFFLGLLTGAIYFWGTLYWLVATMTSFGGLATPLAVFAATLLVAYLSLFPAAFSVIVNRLTRRLGTAAVLIAPAVWVATELGRTYIWDGFPWELLGYSQVRQLPVAQIASVVGVYGLSGFVALVSAGAAFVALDDRRRRWWAAAGIAVLLVGLTAWGAVRLRRGTLDTQGTVVRVAVIQGNIAQEQKNAAYEGDPLLGAAITARYLAMTRAAVARGATFIIWPESSVPFYFDQDPRRAEPIRRLAREAHVTILLGSDQIEAAGAPAPGRPPDNRYYNAAFVVGPDGRTKAAYRKIHLVPFGEYVPLKRLLFFVGPIVQAVSDFSPGTRAVMLPVAGHKVSTAICYEVIYASLIRDFVQDGSELLTTITNDAWYGRSSAPFQHWEQAAMRSIEEGRFLARAANTGISGFVDPYGRVRQQSRMFDSAILADDLRFLTDRTIYSRIGDLVAWLSLALTVAALLATGGRRT